MSTYLRKPKMIEAIQWKGNLKEIKDFVTEDVIYLRTLNTTTLLMDTSDGGCWSAKLGDYICRYTYNKYFICKREDFEREYEYARS